MLKGLEDIPVINRQNDLISLQRILYDYYAIETNPDGEALASKVLALFTEDGKGFGDILEGILSSSLILICFEVKVFLTESSIITRGRIVCHFRDSFCHSILSEISSKTVTYCACNSLSLCPYGDILCYCLYSSFTMTHLFNLSMLPCWRILLWCL